jgi:hypothetical protein
LLSVSSFSTDAAVLTNTSCSICDVVTDTVVLLEAKQVSNNQ